MPNHYLFRTFPSPTCSPLLLLLFLLLLLCSNLPSTIATATPVPAPAVNPVYRDVMLAQLRASERYIARNYCAVCYESIADFSADTFRDEAGLMRSGYANVNNMQPMARAIRMSAKALSESKYAGSDIPEDQHLAECSAFLKGYTLDLLRVDIAETDPDLFFLLPTPPFAAETRRAALEAYVDELTNTDRFTCVETFALAGR